MADPNIATTLDKKPKLKRGRLADRKKQPGGDAAYEADILAARKAKYGNIKAVEGQSEAKAYLLADRAALQKSKVGRKFPKPPKSPRRTLAGGG